MTHENHTKHLLHSAADKYDAGPPPVAELLRSGKRAKKRRSVMVVAATVAAVAAVAVGGLALRPVIGSDAVPMADTTETQPTADDASVLERIKGLTGKDVGDALGLVPMPTGSAPCDATFAEFEDPPGDDNAMGFCLDGVTDDPSEERLVAGQIVGNLPVDVPTVVGLELKDAEAALEPELRLHHSLPDADARPHGSTACPITPDAVVTRQDPADEQLPEGYFITVYVDSGVFPQDCPETRPGPVVVAQLRNWTHKDATRLTKEYLDIQGVAGACACQPSVRLFTAPDVTEQELDSLIGRLQDEPGVEKVSLVELEDL
jgi:hypothetical protein